MYREKILDHLKKLVQLYPETKSQESVLEALKYCQGILQDIGLNDATLHTKNGFYSLTASTNHKKHSKLLLMAHIDVVPALPEDECEFEIDDDFVCGRGVYDMLFAVASYLTLLQNHKSDLKSFDIGLMITGDEEIGGFNGTQYLVDQGYGGEVAFLPDAGESFGDLSVSSKGAFNFDLLAKGEAHHGSRPWEGDGAGNKLILMVHELMDAFDHDDHDNSTITVTRFEGGGAINRGPKEASAHIDIRFKHQHDYQKIKLEVARICKHYGGEIKNLLEADDLKIDTSNPAIKEFIKLYEEHAGQKITLSKAHGGSDARFLAKKGVPVIMLRPDGTGAHGDKETLNVDSLMKFYDLLEDFTLKTAKIR